MADRVAVGVGVGVGVGVSLGVGVGVGVGVADGVACRAARQDGLAGGCAGPTAVPARAAGGTGGRTRARARTGAGGTRRARGTRSTRSTRRARCAGTRRARARARRTYGGGGVPGRRGGGRGVLEVQQGRRGRGDRDHGEAGQQAFGGEEVAAEAVAVGAAADVPGDPLAPDRVRGAVEPHGDLGELGAARIGAEGADHDPAGLQLLLHPLDADGGVLRAQVQGLGQLGAGEFTARLQPPQGEQLAVVRVQPAGGLGHFAPLAGQAEPQDGQVGEVGPGVGDFPGLVQAADGGLLLSGGMAAADLVHGDGDQPGPEGLRLAQPVQAVQGPDHGLLGDVVHVGVAAEGAAGHVVDERQPGGDQGLLGLPVTCLRRAYQGRPGPVLHISVHGPHSVLPCFRPPLPPGRPVGSDQITTM